MVTSTQQVQPKLHPIAALTDLEQWGELAGDETRTLDLIGKS
jgi:hypothetical protein